VTVTAKWTDPSEGGPLDRDTGQTIREQDWDGVLGNLLMLGGSSGTIAKYNLLTNGGFEIWQRGNGPFNANGVYAADRWSLSFGAGTLSITRDTANVDTGSLACAAVAYTHSSASFLLQKVEDFNQLRGRTTTFSMRIRTSSANAVRLRIDITGAAQTVNSAYHSGGGTYETLSVPVTVGAAATGVIVYVQLDASCTAYLDNAMLVVGSVAADYAPLHPADDLARCLRYYEIIGETLNEIARTGYAAAGGADDVYSSFHTRKGVNPTVTKTGTWIVTNCAQPSLIAYGPNGMTLRTIVTALGAFAYNNNASGATVTIEANP